MKTYIIAGSGSAPSTSHCSRLTDADSDLWRLAYEVES